MNPSQIAAGNHVPNLEREQSVNSGDGPCHPIAFDLNEHTIDQFESLKIKSIIQTKTLAFSNLNLILVSVVSNSNTNEVTNVVLGMLNIDGCMLRPLHDLLPAETRVDADFKVMLVPSSGEPGGQKHREIYRLRWFPVCGHAQGRACEMGVSLIDEDVGSMEGLRPTSHRDDGVYWGFAPTWIDDSGQAKDLMALFKFSGDASKQCSVDKDQLKCGGHIVSAPVFANQRISAFDVSSPYVVYVVSNNGSEGGWYGHLLSVIRLDDWLLNQPDSDGLLQEPIMQVTFEGPEVTGVRFGSKESEGFLVLKSEPTQSVFEVIWKPSKLKGIVCELYRNWPNRHEQSVEGEPLLHTPAFQETIGQAAVQPCPEETSSNASAGTTQARVSE
jgi:hypothetical protein